MPTPADWMFATITRTFSSVMNSVLMRSRCAELVSPVRMRTPISLDAKTEMDYIFYTQTLNGEQLQRVPEEAFSQTVSFLQSYIEKQFELRVTVVGQDVFAAKIDSQKYAKGQGAEDWRQAEDPDKFLSSYEMKEEDQKKCLEVVTRLGLNFGCLDFVVQPDGELVFLECNPNGQWLWIELATKAPISESIAIFLANHN